MTLAEALRSSPIDVREARLLLAAAAGIPESSVLAFAERALAEQAQARYLEWARRRLQGEPVAYILGRKEFYGLELAVSCAVLVPRPETELLVELALERAGASVADIGTGSGAVALAIKHHRGAARVVGVDVSAAALAVARRNAANLGLEVDFREGSWLAPLGSERYQLIVSNPPYVALGDPHLEALRFEPSQALLGGSDGLAAIRELIAQAPANLSPGGWLLLEHGIGQESAVRALLQAAGLEGVATWADLSGIPRVSGGMLGRTR